MVIFPYFPIFSIAMFNSQRVSDDIRCLRVLFHGFTGLRPHQDADVGAASHHISREDHGTCLSETNPVLISRSHFPIISPSFPNKIQRNYMRNCDRIYRSADRPRFFCILIMAHLEHFGRSAYACIYLHCICIYLHFDTGSRLSSENASSIWY